MCCRQVAGMYSWERVAVRTERVYDAVADSRRDDTFLARLQRFYKWVQDLCPSGQTHCPAVRVVVTPVLALQLDVTSSANIVQLLFCRLEAAGSK